MDREKEETTYKRDLYKRIELINLENMKNAHIKICNLIESKMNDIIDKINEIDSIIEANSLHIKLRILDWVFFQVCSNERKRIRLIK